MQLEDYIQLYQPATIRKHAMEIETTEAELLRIDRVFHSGELYYKATCTCIFHNFIMLQLHKE